MNDSLLVKEKIKKVTDKSINDNLSGSVNDSFTEEEIKDQMEVINSIGLEEDENYQEIEEVIDRRQSIDEGEIDDNISEVLAKKT